MRSGFQLLNLKNDFLRKRFDGKLMSLCLSQARLFNTTVGIKYDVKKIEEVNFEIALRGLAKKDTPTSTTSTTTPQPAEHPEKQL